METINGIETNENAVVMGKNGLPETVTLVQKHELTDECIDRIANAVAKKLREAAGVTRDTQTTAEDAIERRMRDLCE